MGGTEFNFCAGRIEGGRDCRKAFAGRSSSLPPCWLESTLPTALDDSETFLAVFQLQIRQGCFHVFGLTCKPCCWARHSPISGNLPHFQALLAPFGPQLSWPRVGGLPNQEKSIQWPAKGTGMESLDNKERTRLISFLVSRIHWVGAKGKAGGIISR